jgi:outer membrane biosynthesis protein TonB
MKIKTITYTQRFNTGNYEYIEISSVAEVEDQEKAQAALEALKQFVANGLNQKIEEKQEVVAELANPEPVKEEVKPEPVVEPVKEKKPKAKKADKPVEVVEEAPKKVAPAIVYNSAIPEHKSILGGYLSKKYDNAWKTVADATTIKEFTASLNGQDFVDVDGKIVDSFLEKIHGFFGA